MPPLAVEDFLGLILKVASQREAYFVLEHFKRHFSLAVGKTNMTSSSTGWAQSDLKSLMDEAANNAVVFIDALYDGFQTLVRQDPDVVIPSDEVLNAVFRVYDVGYQIIDNGLQVLDPTAPLVEVETSNLDAKDDAIEMIRDSLNRSEELLQQGHGKEAVQESLWLLESISTEFQGIATDTGAIVGQYFNEIINELKRSNRGKAMDVILRWISNIHGYLSSPTGGGVRHGLHLKKGLRLSHQEARLFCNLIRSFTDYFIAESARLKQK